ncbi:MAG: hypothetical protein IJX80_03230 [Clostridia bacterium]|nr:hypothetical protein [Clostridia bacterium]
MNHYIDWNCRLLRPGAIPNETAYALREMNERFSFNRFCMMQDFHADTESVSAFLIRQKRALQQLKPLLSRRFHIHGAACVHLCRGLAEEADLDRLTITSERLLPLQLPLTEYGDWIDQELNSLLYKKKLTPLFLSFELCMLLYPKEIIEKLLRIPFAAYQFNYKALPTPEICRAIFKLLSKSTVLLGTSLNMREKINFYELPYYLQRSEKLLLKRFHLLLLERNQAYWQEW